MTIDNQTFVRTVEQRIRYDLDEIKRRRDEADQHIQQGAMSGQQNLAENQMRPGSWQEVSPNHYTEGNKRMRDAVNAMPTANEKQVSGNHYKDMPIQPWAIMEAVMTPEEFIGFLKGNIIKYALRAGRKEGSDDAGKAKHYMEKLNEMQGSY